MAEYITLTTDWHSSDYYIGAIKASILSRIPSVSFVDISHNIESFSFQQAAFVLKNSYENFPNGTIHIIGVDSEPDKKGNIVIAVYKNQFFICNNNGCLGLIFDKKPEQAIIIDTGFAFEGSTFPELSIFTDLACYIIKSGKISELGEVVDDIKRFPEFGAQIEPNTINGEVIYVDSYSNLITNITKQMFEENVSDSKFEILLNSNSLKTDQVHLSYKEVDTGEIVCIFNSINLLEIAIREGKAAQLLNLNRKSQIRIKFNL